MEYKDIVLTRGDNMYMTDFSEWAREEADDSEDGYGIGDIDLVLMTVQEREVLYTKKEVEKARVAGEFLWSVGFPSEKKAMHLIRDSNLVNILHSVYAGTIPYIWAASGSSEARGKTTKQHVKSTESVDMGAMEQQTMQEMCTDVTYAVGEKFLISVCSPLELTIISHMESLSMEALGACLQRVRVLRQGEYWWIPRSH
jgi:hypothetical protein